MSGYDEANTMSFMLVIWPSKALIFNWRLVLNRLPLRVELVNCHIIVGAHNTACPLCFLDDESLDHIFLLCPISIRIWIEARGYIGVVVPPFSGSLATCFLDFIEVAGAVVKRKMLWFFGLVVCWVIWCCRNVIVFKGGIFNKIDVLGMIKFISWEWLLASNLCENSY